MHKGNGDIGEMEEMKKKYRHELNELVPVPANEIKTLKNWGKKKRLRYAELLKEGATNDEAFDVVENYGGEIPEKYKGGGITLSDDFKMTMKNPITGKTKVMEQGKDYTIE